MAKEEQYLRRSGIFRVEVKRFFSCRKTVFIIKSIPTYPIPVSNEFLFLVYITLRATNAILSSKEALQTPGIILTIRYNVFSCPYANRNGHMYLE